MKRFFSLFFLIAVVLSGLYAQSDLQTIAIVKLGKTEPITLQQLKARCTAVEFQYGRPLTVEERKVVLDQLINEKLIIHAAELENIAISGDQLNQLFNEFISRQLGQAVTEEQFNEMIKQQMGITLDEYMKKSNGMSVAEFKQYLKSQLIAQQYITSKKSDELKKVEAPTDKEISDYYELRKNEFARPDRLTIFLVMAEKGTTEESAKAADKLIRDLQSQLKKNPKNADSIAEKGMKDGSGYKAGNVYILKNVASAQQLGITLDGLIEIFDKKDGYLSEITENDANYQFFMVRGKEDAKILTLNDELQPGSGVTVKDYIREGLLAEEQNFLLEQALNDSIVELRKDSNFSYQKSGENLDKVLGW